jgi:hypothetical protein
LFKKKFKKKRGKKVLKEVKMLYLESFCGLEIHPQQLG